MPADLAAFLAERLNEAEQNISYAGPARIAWLTYLRDDGQPAYTTVAAGDDSSPWCADGRELPEPASARVVWDPARELRAIAAKRAILAAHKTTVTERETYPFSAATGEPIPAEYDGDCEICGWFDPGQGGCLTVRQLGTEWNDHPAYLPEWSPELVDA